MSGLPKSRHDWAILRQRVLEKPLRLAHVLRRNLVALYGIGDGHCADIVSIKILPGDRRDNEGRSL